VSAESAFPIAPLIVAHGVEDEKQSLLSLPFVATYHGPEARAGQDFKAIPASPAIATTIIVNRIPAWQLGFMILISY
jgi:hypothetical protein